MNSKKVKIGIIGLGNQGKKHLDSVLKLKNVDVVGVCDAINLLNESTIPFFNNYANMYEIAQPDIVIIATPNYLHKQLTLDAFEKGIHVIKEKPLASNYQDALDMIGAAKKAGKILATMQQRYYSPLYNKARLYISSLGAPINFSYKFTLNDTANSWRWDLGKAGGGSWLNMGWHGISMIQWLLGYVSKVDLDWKIGGKRDWEYQTDHSSYAKVLLENSAQGTLFLSCTYPKAEMLKITFEKGVLYLSRKGLDIFSNNAEEVHIEDTSSEADHYLEQLRSLIHKIETNSYDMEPDMKIMSVIQKGIDSANVKKVGYHPAPAQVFLN